jgi:hypothetical protein
MFAGFMAGILSATARADGFLAMPGLWRITYEVEAAGPRVVWHCVDEKSDPWIAFAQLQDLPGMTCAKTQQDRKSTSLNWKMRCQGPGPDAVADVLEISGTILFDSPQHYNGWVRFSGTLLGYPVDSRSKIDGSRKAACTSPSD